MSITNLFRLFQPNSVQNFWDYIYPCLSPNYFYIRNFKAIHTYVHNTVVPLQYYSPHYTHCPVTTLVQVGETFLLLSALL